MSLDQQTPIHSLIREIDYGTPRAKTEKTVTLDDRRRRDHRAGGHLDHARGDGARDRNSRNSAPPTCWTRSAPAGCAWSRSKAAPARRPPARRRSPTAWWCAPQTRPAEAAAQGRHGALHLRSSARLPDLLGQRRLRAAETWPAPSACAKCATAIDGANHPQSGHRRIQSLFHLRSRQVHRLFALRARLRGGARHLCADHCRPRLRFGRRRRDGRDVHRTPNACPAAPAYRPARPATLIEKSVIEIGTPEHSVVTTCAYCGVGCSFKAEMRGDEVVRMVPYKDGKANRGHSCVKGRFAWGYANHRSASSSR